jgi:hypothetical protein
MMEIFGVRVQYLEEIETKPDLDENRQQIEDTGGRNDVFFAVHSDDLSKFAIPRLSVGIRWLEDVYLNGNGSLYDDRVAEYMCWSGMK